MFQLVYRSVLAEIVVQTVATEFAGTVQQALFAMKAAGVWQHHLELEKKPLLQMKFLHPNVLDLLVLILILLKVTEMEGQVLEPGFLI